MGPLRKMTHTKLAGERSMSFWMDPGGAKWPLEADWVLVLSPTSAVTLKIVMDHSDCQNLFRLEAVMLVMLSGHSKGCLLPKRQGIKQDKKPAGREHHQPWPCPTTPSKANWADQETTVRLKQESKSSDKVVVMRQIKGQARNMNQQIRFRSGDSNQGQSSDSNQGQSSDHWASLSIITRRVRGQARKTGCRSAYELSRYGHDGAAGRSTYSIPQAGTEPMGRGRGWRPQVRLLRAFKA